MRLHLIPFASFALSLSALLACGGGAPPPAADPSGTPAPVITTPPAPVTTTKGPDKPESNKVTWKKDAPAKNCHTGTKGPDPISAVTGIASRCIDTTKMHQVGQPTQGEGLGSTDTMVKSIPLAAKANHCYRIFGLAEPTVTDFDIAVMDSTGKSAGEDGTDTNDAIVLEDGSICFTQDDAANVNTAVASGKGKWAVEIWSD